MAGAERTLTAKFTDVEIEATLVRFEELYQQWVKRKMYKRPCRCCTHPERIEINRRLLQGKEYGNIARFAGIEHQLDVRNHWQRHLSYAVKITDGTFGELMAATVEKLARLPFPVHADRAKQLKWCIRMYHVMREVELNKITGKSNPFIEIDTMGYMQAINRIRETVIMLHDKKKSAFTKMPNTTELEPDDDWISDETRGTLEAQAERAKFRKHAEVVNGNGTQGKQRAESDQTSPADGGAHGDEKRAGADQ